MNKLVRMRDVQDAIDNLEWYSNGGKVYVRQTELVDAVDSIPAVDAVEVVRCRECKRWDSEWDDGEEHNCKADACCHPGWWFCPWGQRREDGLYESLKRGLEEAIAKVNGG